MWIFCDDELRPCDNDNGGEDPDGEGGGIEKMRRGEDDRDREWDQGWEGTKNRGPWGNWGREEDEKHR